MRKKIMGILLMGLLVSTIFPMVSADNTPKQIEILIKGGQGFKVDIKNLGVKDINDVKIQIFVDGLIIFKNYRHRDLTMDLKAGETSHLVFPILGFGSAYVTVTVGTISQSTSGKLFGFFAFKVK